MLGSDSPPHVLSSQGSGGILPCSPDSTAAPTSGTTNPPAEASSMPDHRGLGELQQILPSRHYPLHYPLRSSFGSDNPRPVLYNLATVPHGPTSTSPSGRFFWSAALGQHSIREHVTLGDSSVDDSSNGYSACRDTSAMGYHYPTVDYGHQDLPTNSAVTSSLQAQTTSSSTPQVYQQPGFHGYSAASMPAVGGAAAQTTPGRMGGYPGTASLDEAYASYQSTLKKIFQNIRDVALVPASDSLLEASGWLLSHVVELGMLFPNRMEHG